MIHRAPYTAMHQKTKASKSLEKAVLKVDARNLNNTKCQPSLISITGKSTKYKLVHYVTFCVKHSLFSK